MPDVRLDRLDRLAARLRAQPGVTMGELAAELGVSARTVRRDVRTLRGRGMEIEGDRGRGGGIRFARDAVLPPLRLDARQAVGLWLAVQLGRGLGGLPFSRGTSAALAQVLSALPPERRQQLRDLCRRIVLGPPASPLMQQSLGDMSPALLDAFEHCFREGVCLSFRYRDRFGAETQRRVEPHGIFVRPPLWYALAVDVDKQARRMFRMDRIANPRPFQRRFSPSLAVVEEMLSDEPCEPLAERNARADR